MADWILNVLWNIGVAFVGLSSLVAAAYIVTRVASIAYYRSKAQFDPELKRNGERNAKK